MMPNKYCRELAELRSQAVHELKEVGDQWRTPENIFWGINAMFGPLVLDLFSDGENSKCEAYYTAEDNALTKDWSARLEELNGAAFGNPPYSRASQHEEQYITGMRYIMQHASAMREKGGRYVFLIKAATSEVWWPEDADHIAFIRGRIGFDLPTWFVPKDEKQVPSGAFFAGAVAVFDKNWRGPAMSYVSRKELEARGDAFLAQIRRLADRLTSVSSLPATPEQLPEKWPAEVSALFDKVSDTAVLTESSQKKVKYHINRMWLERMPMTEIIKAASEMAAVMEKAA
nr:phage N-6-adenine-methyltransferase [Atlantibacter sp.]